jgi:short-subunit dehydrogenase
MNVVITGASSGIGKAAAHEFARLKANITITARRQKELDETVEEIANLGGKGFCVPADVSDRNAVSGVLERALKQFGNIDIWINNAAVSVFGRFEDIPEHVYHRVVEVNIIGYFNGASIVIPYFKKQKKGLLINVSSTVGIVAEPFSAPYVATKFAIRGFSESLRNELRGTGIKVCTVLPASIDTPMHQYAANYMGKKEKPLRPLNDAYKVARVIVRLARHPRSEVHVGKEGALLSVFHNIIPWATEPIYSHFSAKGHFENRDEPPTEGNLFTPITGGRVSGGWKKNRRDHLKEKPCRLR